MRSLSRQLPHRSCRPRSPDRHARRRESRGVIRVASHARRPRRSAGHLRHRDADAGRTAPQRQRQTDVDGQRSGCHRRRGEQTRLRSRAAEPRGSRGPAGRRTRRRLQQLLARRRDHSHPRGRTDAQLAHHRSARRQDSADDSRRRRQRNDATFRNGAVDADATKRIGRRSGSTPSAFDDPGAAAARPSAACSDSARPPGPPTLPNYFYNNLKQIVQTPDTDPDPRSRWCTTRASSA